MKITLPAPEPADVIAARGAMSQADAAALIGASRDGWAKWESAARQMPVSAWTLFLLVTDQHPSHRLGKRSKRTQPPPPP